MGTGPEGDVKRETCEKDATWTDWTPPSSRPAILQWCFALVQDVQAIDVLLWVGSLRVGVRP